MDKIKRTQILHIFQADFEYLISILVTSSFLATITAQMGISDSLTGIITAVISLGNIFQLFSMLIRRRRVKRIIIFFSVINQLVFMMFYVIPLIELEQSVKTALFVFVNIAAYFFFNIIRPKTTDWYMSMIDDKRRGRYTSIKEMVSLASGMIFTYVMGSISDHYKAKGEIRTSFIICAIVLFVLMLVHTLTLIFSAEKEPEQKRVQVSLSKKLQVFGDKEVLKVTGVFVLWYAATYAATPFYGSYQINELGFSLKYVSVLSIIYGVVRILFSFVWGSYADKKSFVSMLRVCLSIAAVGYFINVFTVPENGKIFYTTYYACYAVAMAGINSALINLVFDYVDHWKRADALAVTQAVSGVIGFAATLVVSPLVSHIQGNGNTFLGIPVYAQQVLSLIALILYILAIIYISVVFMKSRKS